jgi:hypothetical protein
MTEPASLANMMNNLSLHPNSNAAAMMRGAGVLESEDFKRVRDLPRRESPRDLSDLITQAYKTPNGTMSLRPLQAYTLTELFDYRGCFAPVPVGGGKSLISLLAPRIMDAQRPLLIVPANLRKKTLDQDIPFYEQHWRIPQNLEVLSYERLQTAKNVDILFDLMPDLIILDECHFVKNRRTARWPRLKAYLDAYPNTVLLAMSGTVTKHSIKDYWHILRYTLPNQCPLPLSWPRVEEWANAIDADVPEDRRVAPGALLQFCAEGENVRQGFRRRLSETPGVIISTQSAFGHDEEPGLEIHEVDPGTPPEEISEAFTTLRTTWETPGGEEISDAISAWRHAGSRARGYYLRWVWPGGQPDLEWLGRRKEWKRFVRETLKNNRRGLDSELRVALACERGDYNSPEYRAWHEIRERYGPSGPPTEAVWISDWIVDHAAQFIHTHRRQGKFLVWTRNPDMGKRLAERIDVPYFGAGDDGILTRRQTCVASLQAHGTGKNLQIFSRNLFIHPPLGGVQWEQTLGRTHRPGQESDTVINYVYLHCKELVKGFHKSFSESVYIEDTTGTPQKLRRATLDLIRGAQDIDDLARTGGPLWG